MRSLTPALLLFATVAAAQPQAPPSASTSTVSGMLKPVPPSMIGKHIVINRWYWTCPPELLGDLGSVEIGNDVECWTHVTIPYGPESPCEEADLTEDGKVNAKDVIEFSRLYALVKKHWGEVCADTHVPRPRPPIETSDDPSEWEEPPEAD